MVLSGFLNIKKQFNEPTSPSSRLAMSSANIPDPTPSVWYTASSPPVARRKSGLQSRWLDGSWKSYCKFAFETKYFKETEKLGIISFFFFFHFGTRDPKSYSSFRPLGCERKWRADTGGKMVRKGCLEEERKGQRDEGRLREKRKGKCPLLIFNVWCISLSQTTD